MGDTSVVALKHERKKKELKKVFHVCDVCVRACACGTGGTFVAALLVLHAKWRDVFGARVCTLS